MSTQDTQAEFDTAFAEAIADTPPAPAAAPVEQPVAPAEPAPVEAAAPAEPAAPVEPATPAEPAPAEPAPAPAAAAPTPADPAPAPVVPQVQLDPSALAQAMAEFQQRQQQSAAPQEPAAPKEPQLDDFLTADEKAVLADYDKEWGEVSKAEQIRTRAAVSLALAQSNAQWEARLAPIEAQLRQSSADSHEGAIHAAHPDVTTIAGDLQKWVAENPISLMRSEGARIIQKGTASEVIDLITLFKQATGRTGAGPASTVASPAAQEPAAPAAPAPAPAPVPSAAAAAATAAVVDSKRAGIPQAKDMTDFESAWAEAVAAT